jgi:hypothetical protein
VQLAWMSEQARADLKKIIDLLSSNVWLELVTADDIEIVEHLKLVSLGRRKIVCEEAHALLRYSRATPP